MSAQRVRRAFDWNLFKWHLLLGASVIPPAACLSQVRPNMNNVLWRHLTERLVKGGASSNDGKQALSLTFPRKREGEAERGGARDNDRERWRELGAVCKCRVLTQFVWRQCVMKCDKTASSLLHAVTDTAAAWEIQQFAIGLKLLKPSVWKRIKQSLADREPSVTRRSRALINFYSILTSSHFEYELRILRSRKDFFFASTSFTIL